MSFWPVAFHIAWFTRVILSVALFLVIIKRRLHRQFPLFAAYAGWIAIAGVVLIVINYASFVSGKQYFAGVAIGNAVETVLAFAIIYQMFVQRLHQYPAITKLGNAAFRVTTLMLIIVAVVLAWFAPGLGNNYLTSLYSVVERSLRTLQCGQLIFLFLFFGYFRLSWRSRVFGIALGLGILSSTTLAIDAIRSQLAVTRTWTPALYALYIASDTTNILALSVWLSYVVLAKEESIKPTYRPPAGDPLPDHDLETWNRELGRLLEP